VSLEAILAAIGAAGDDAVARARSDLEGQLRHIEAEAEMNARTHYEAACRAAQLPVGRECARLQHRARLDSLRLLGQARQELIDTALDEIRQRLRVVRQSAEYTALLRRLIEEALDALGAKEVAANPPSIIVDGRDETLVRDILRGNDGIARATLDSSLECWGGVIVRSGDGQITVDNRLETRLDRAMPVLQRELAAAFERAAAGEPTPGLVPVSARGAPESDAGL
jgi:vacuolar-type H+-ATPase subunit E/Vma4